MAVLTFTRSTQPNPAIDALGAARLTPEDAPALCRFLSLYYKAAGAQGGHGPGARILSQQFKALRLHHRPVYLTEDDLPEFLFCGAAASILDDTVAARVFAMLPQAEQEAGPMAAGWHMASRVKAAIGGTAGTELARAFHALAPAEQMIYLLNASQFARHYIDIKANPGAALAGRFHGKTGRRILHQYRMRLNGVEQALAGHSSSMADLYTGLMGTIRKLDAIPAAAAGQQPGARP